MSLKYWAIDSEPKEITGNAADDGNKRGSHIADGIHSLGIRQRYICL